VDFDTGISASTWQSRIRRGSDGSRFSLGIFIGDLLLSMNVFFHQMSMKHILLHPAGQITGEKVGVLFPRLPIWRAFPRTSAIKTYKYF